MWEEIYKKHSTENIRIGIADWRQRSTILMKWLRQQKIGKDAKILDCGCGIGIAGIILKENGYNDITGIDINKKNVEISSRFFRTFVGDCSKLKIKEKYNVILALNLIEHIKNPERFLENIKSAIKPDGLLILSLPNEVWFRKLVGAIPHDKTHVQSWSYYSFKKFLKRNGLTIIDMKPVGRIPFLFMCNTMMVLVKL